MIGGDDIIITTSLLPKDSVRELLVATNGGIPCPESTGKGSRLEDQAAMSSGDPSGIPAETGKSGESRPPLRLNPYFSAWLMGFQVGWTKCGQRVASLFVRKSKAGFSS